MSNLFTSLGIDPGILIILLMIISVVLIFMVMSLYREVQRMKNKYKYFMKGEDGKSLEKGFTRRFEEIDRVVDNQTDLDNQMRMIETVQGRSLLKYGIVKYDAFEDVGGKLSFALAMLDNSDTGFVINAIHSKENCFTYIKEVVNGESYIMLSDEEIQALRFAKDYGQEDSL